MLNCYFIRHAESEANAHNHRICGRSDHIPLSARGWQQARQLAQRLQQEQFHFDHLYSSVSLRALQTAEVVCQALNYDMAQVQTSDQIVELSKGQWEGEVRREMYTPAVMRELQADPYHFATPGGESQQQVEERMYQWLQQLQQQYAGQDLNIGIFSHGFAIKALYIKLFEADKRAIYRTIVHNTSISSFQYDGSEWLVERINDHAHLAGTEFVGHYW